MPFSAKARPRHWPISNWVALNDFQDNGSVAVVSQSLVKGVMTNWLGHISTEDLRIRSNVRTCCRTLAIVTVLLAVGVLLFALVRGGDILMIVLGLMLAATSMKLFQNAKAENNDG
jgi:uncharacterized membrane protein YiaA